MTTSQQGSVKSIQGEIRQSDPGGRVEHSNTFVEKEYNDMRIQTETKTRDIFEYMLTSEFIKLRIKT